MAERSNQNFLNYTKLTFSELIQEINDRLKSDDRFRNFRESAISQTMLEIFASLTDLVNYYLERRAEEQFMDTAQLRSSVISLASQLGYVVIRPVPANTSLSMTIKGPLPSGLLAGTDKITIQKYDTNFTYDGFGFVSKNTYAYTITSGDLQDGVDNPNFRKVIDAAILDENELALDEFGNVPTSALQQISLVQGDIEVVEFKASDPQSPRGEIFQSYEINDPSFSNYYGDQDLGYDASTGEANLPQDITKVGIGLVQSAAFDDENLYEIDRRSLLTSQTVLDATSVSANVPQVCTIQTMMSEGVKVQFGDGIISKKGPVTINDNLFVQYLSTDGANANSIGVINEKLQPKVSFKTSNTNIDLTNNLEFRLNSNITGGANIEEIDSIKINAPKLFYSLDRLVTKSDYVTYLESLTSPLNIQNALAWGEQEEIKDGLVNDNSPSIKALFNVILTSVSGPLYTFPPGGEAQSKDLTTSADQISTFLEGTDHTLYSDQTLFNLLVTGQEYDCGGNTGVIREIGKVESLPESNPVSVVIKQLDSRAQITSRHIYVPPIVQNYRLDGEIFVRNLDSLNDVRVKVNNAIYNFLNTDIDFQQPLYISNIVDIIENFKEVVYADVKFLPYGAEYNIMSGTVSDQAEIQNIATVSQRNAVTNIINSALVNFSTAGDVIITSATNGDYDIQEYYDIILDEDTWSKASPWVTELEGHSRLAGLTEREFYFNLMRTIYDNIKNDIDAAGWEETDDFKSFMFKLNNQMKRALRSSVLDKSGNLMNYSMRNEIPKITVTANYRYR